MQPTMQDWKRLALTGCMVLVLNACGRIPVRNRPPYIAPGSQVHGAVGNVVNLDQGWSQDVQEYWYFTSQGSQIIPYDWFLHLEQATNTDLFRSEANIKRLRFLPQVPTRQNPDGLPVGFAKDVNDPKYGGAAGEWVGFNCSACHTAQIEFDDEGRAFRIEGGPALADVNTFLVDLVASLEATLTEPPKFGRFAANVLGADSASGSPRLEGLLRDRAAALQTRLDNNLPPVASGPAGYARLDAVNNIFNQVLGQDLDAPPPNDVTTQPTLNLSDANAPVSFPALWDAPHTDLVQWTGFVNNKEPGPIVRNLTEVMGVFATFSFDEASPGREQGYQSSVKVKKQGWLEEWLTSLWSPQWPEQHLGAIDTTLTKQGEGLYLTYCQSCHAVLGTLERTDPGREIAAQMWSLPYIGTDSLNIKAVSRLANTMKTGKIQGSKEQYLRGPELQSEEPGHSIIGNAVEGVLRRKPVATIGSLAESFRTHIPKAPPFDPRSYRARPLNGVWATAPYLHNGSVPNLLQLLTRAEARVDSFYVGNRRFDTLNVGYVLTMPSDGNATLLLTRLLGNSNSGHEYGVDLTNEQKQALIEYIKSL